MDSNLAQTLKEDYLTCVICYELFVDPKVLPCLHTFCKGCLEILIAKSPEKENPLCPICREPFSLPSQSVSCLKSNFIFTEMIAKLTDSKKRGSSSKRLCSFCILHSKEVEATHKCVTCLDLLCSFCVRHRHIFTRQNAFHQIVHLKDYLTGKCIEKKNPEVLCESHMERIRFFCPTCSVPICGECALNEHRFHDYRSFDEARGIIEQEMKKAIENSRAKQDKLKQEHLKLASQSQEVSSSETSKLEEVDKNFQEIQRKLMKYRQDIEDDIKRKFNEEKKKIKVCLKKNVSLQNGLQESISFCENILLKRSDLEVVFFLDDMKSTLLKHSVHEESEMQVFHPCLEINFENELHKIINKREAVGNENALETATESKKPSVGVGIKADTMSSDAECSEKTRKVKQETNLKKESGKSAQNLPSIIPKCLKTYDFSKIHHGEPRSYTSVAWIDSSSFAVADEQSQCALIVSAVHGITTHPVDGIVGIAKISDKIACKTSPGKIIIYSYPKLNLERTFNGAYTLSSRSSDLVWVTRQEIVIFNGHSLKEMKILDEDGNVFKFKRPFHFCCLPNDSFALTEKTDDHLYLLDKRGQLYARRMVSGQLGALSCDKDNRIYMTRYEDNAICIFDADGEYLRTVSLSCILKKPRAIAVMNKDAVLVASRDDVVLLSLT